MKPVTTLMEGCGILEHQAVALNTVLRMLRTSDREAAISLIGAYNTTGIPAYQTLNKWIIVTTTQASQRGKEITK